MRKYFLFAAIAISFTNYGFGQTARDKAITDSLVNEWNVRFESDVPEKLEEILAKNVTEISGSTVNHGRDSVMINFVKRRMPVISNLKAVNEFYSVSKDIIYTAGRYTLKVRRSETESVEARGNFTFVWTKQKDGHFKMEFIHIESVPRS
jgi:hypothetical protein